MTRKRIPTEGSFRARALEDIKYLDKATASKEKRSRKALEKAVREAFVQVFEIEPERVEGDVVEIEGVRLQLRLWGERPVFHVLGTCLHCGREGVPSVPCYGYGEVGAQLQRFVPMVEGEHYCGVMDL